MNFDEKVSLPVMVFRELITISQSSIKMGIFQPLKGQDITVGNRSYKTMEISKSIHYNLIRRENPS